MKPLHRLGAALKQGHPRAGLALLGLAVVSVGALLIEGTRPSIGLAPRIPHLDKLLHAGAHALVATLLVWGIALIRPIAPWKPASLALTLDAAAGLAVELIQLGLGREHGRQFDWWDVAANLCGGIGAAIAFLWVARSAITAYTGLEKRPG